MATLVLTTVGAALGGPVGGAIGALLGQQVDTRLFAKRRTGPRLGELAVQTSTYGSPIPKLFGTMRVAGTVIWATDLKEDVHREGGGKGAPKTTRYSYSASFAVALSARPIRAVGRIWADGKLLRGAAGDWKSQTGFRLHLGGEDQPVDPLIAAVEGIGAAPAYRGIAYAVFEALQLEDFGNRIPSLSFEVEADAGPVAVSAIAGALSGGRVAGTTGAMFAGYAAGGDSVRAAIETIAQAVPLSIHDDGTRLVLGDAAGTAIALPDEALGATVSDTAARRAIERQAAGTLPDEIGIAHHAPERDWQPGLQRARRSGAVRRSETIELPAAMPAATAKALAERRLATRWAERVQAKALLPWHAMAIRPGETVASSQLGGRFRVARWTLERMVLTLDLVREAASPVHAAPASAGRSSGDPDQLRGDTVIAVMDLPLLEETLASRPRLWIAAAGTEPGWRRATLSASLDDGASWETIGGTAAPAVIGTVIAPPGPGGSARFDLRGSIEVELLHDGMWIEPRQDGALAGGANLALIGAELIQFGEALPIGGNRFRLSRLLRGRRGTEWAAAGHAPGERFVLIQPAALVAFDPPASALGGVARIVASGLAADPEVEASVAIFGDAVRPPAPVWLRARLVADGIGVTWVRRSRAGWTWSDGGDAPLGEEAERYRITVAQGGTRVRRGETMTPAWTYSAAMQAADGVSGAITILIEQLGTHATSRAAWIELVI